MPDAEPDTQTMHPGITFLGCFLGLLATTNDVIALDYQIPFIYNEVTNPTSDDLDSFQHAVKLVLNKTTIPFKPTNILSFYRKIDVIRLSYKAYFRTSEGNICFVKWRDWASNFTTISVHSCDWEDSQEVKKGEDGSNSVEDKSTLEKPGGAILRKNPKQKLPVKNIGRSLIFPRVQATGMLKSPKKGVTVFMIANSTVAIYENGTVKWSKNRRIKPLDDDEPEGKKVASKNLLRSDRGNLDSGSLESETDSLHLLKSNYGYERSRNPGKHFGSGGKAEHILRSKLRTLLGGNRGFSILDEDGESDQTPKMGYMDVHDAGGYGDAQGAPVMRAPTFTARYLRSPQDRTGSDPIQWNKYGRLEISDEDQGTENVIRNREDSSGEGKFENTGSRVAYGFNPRRHPGWVPKADRQVNPKFIPYIKRDARRFNNYRITKAPFRKHFK